MTASMNPAAYYLAHIFYRGDISKFTHRDLKTITASFAPLVGVFRNLIQANHPVSPQQLRQATTPLEKWKQDIEEQANILEIIDPNIEKIARSLGDDYYTEKPLKSKIPTHRIVDWNDQFITPTAQVLAELKEKIGSNEYDHYDQINAIREALHFMTRGFQLGAAVLNNYVKAFPDPHPSQHPNQDSVLDRVMGNTVHSRE